MSKVYEAKQAICRQRVFLEKDLSEMQRRKVEMLADKLLDMNLFELRYFALLTKEKI
jgi:hypothetical protein